MNLLLFIFTFIQVKTLLRFQIHQLNQRSTKLIFMNVKMEIVIFRPDVVYFGVIFQKRTDDGPEKN